MATKPKKKRKAAEPNGNLKQVMDPIIAKALSNRLRGHILATLGERIASPKEISAEIGVDVKELNYHVRVLVESRLIRLVYTRKRRGATEHFYEATTRFLLDERDWPRLPKSVRPSVSADMLDAMVAEAVAALEAGTFDARNRHLSRTPLIVDEQGWRELMDVACETLERVVGIHRECSDRLERSGEAGVPVSMLMAGFERAAAPVPERRPGARSGA